MTSRVKPPLLEKELVDMFMGTLQGLYYEKMVGSVSSGFADLVTIGERIEAGIKSGKITGGPSNAPTIQEGPLQTSPKEKREKLML